MSMVPTTVLPPQELQEVRSPMDMPVELFRAGLQRRGDNRKALMDWIKTSMVEGTDFGKIHTVGKTKCPLAAQGRAAECTNQHHWSKPVLFQPGAQKICGMLGVFVSYPSMTKYEDAALSGVDLKHVILKCEIRDLSGTLVGDGMGARSLEQDYGDLNKALKMAAKSAQISATLRMAGLSEVFTQDLEDMQDSAAQKKEEHWQARIDSYVKKFLEALDADIEENETANLIRSIQQEMHQEPDYLELNLAVWRFIQSKDRAMIKSYLEKTRHQQQPNGPRQADAPAIDAEVIKE